MIVARKKLDSRIRCHQFKKKVTEIPKVSRVDTQFNPAFSGHYILDSVGRVVHVGISEWARWFENGDNRKFARTQITKDMHVSTVFLGLDHGYSQHPSELPVLWETMIFGENLKGDLVDYQHRFTGRAQAALGHNTAIRVALKSLNIFRRYFVWKRVKCEMFGGPTVLQLKEMDENDRIRSQIIVAILPEPRPHENE